MSDTIIVRREGSVARIEMNRPALGNALTIPMAKALLEAAIEQECDPSVRCVVLTGAGKLFCAGGDVGAFSEAGDDLPHFLLEITTYLHAAQLRLLRMNKPLVTAVNGAAAGAGIGLAVIGDVALASPNASFALAYTGIGLSPDAGTTWLLPRLIGLRKAQELCIRNRRIDAQEAAALGMVTRVVTEDLQVEAMTLAHELAASATSAIGATRRLLLDGASSSLETHFDAETRSIAMMGGTPEGREGIAAFAERRAPQF